jgi:hypothetical protein
MDGPTRPRSVVALLFAVFSSCLVGPGSAGDAHKRLPEKAPIYVSPRLEKEFLGAVSINLRVDDKVTPRKAELRLLELVSKKWARPTRYKTKVIPIVLEKAPGNSDSYVVSRMPADLIKPDETLTVRLSSASGEGDCANLALGDSDGNVRREIKLTQVRLPKEPVQFEKEKADDTR